MDWPGIAIAYLAVHFAAYLLVLRKLRVFAREWVIASYHFVSFGVLLGFLCITQAILTPFGLAAIAIHAIYSLSFLEVWALADASYSLSILEHVDRARKCGSPSRYSDLQTLQVVGTSKRHLRVASLVRLRLARTCGGYLELTRAGRCAALVLGIVAWTAHIQRDG